jgi:hypothetical protein
MNSTYILIGIYNLVFLAVAYKSINDHLALEHLRRQIETQSTLDAALKVDSWSNVFKNELIVQLVLGCLVVGLVFYGVSSVNSTLQDSVITKGYVAGKRYLVSVLDYYTGSDTTPPSTPSQGVPVEIPHVLTPLIETPIIQESVRLNYTPHTLSYEDQGLENVIVEEMSTVANHLTQLGLW